MSLSILYYSDSELYEHIMFFHRSDKHSEIIYMYMYIAEPNLYRLLYKLSESLRYYALTGVNIFEE